ncbi:hypothetical protein ILUMI_18695 [Ignelater luminosus]|uniref:HAUS augmin-like complex subunit 6 N-terminal domain-containing protein n=1 Tax=Ignelater luminosus TaxID=2038154 RepID=A0A8K0CJF5_IGNLU|nr:hypothetical protein ILUMI_18695 [Ignelater luminosus]
MALRAQKELEQKLHEEFYKNVHTLTLIHPSSKEFNNVFKKDMFVKNNKVGFHQVVYYLLGILDSAKLRQKVPTWPPHDIRSENQFRNEVMKYINELNTIYVDANIPQIATSHLISPGGFKFVKFMFKLSQLVLHEVIKCRPHMTAGLLLPIKPSKQEVVTTENIRNLRAVTNKINTGTEQLKQDLDRQFNEAKVEAADIIDKQQETTQRIKQLHQKLHSLKKENGDNFTSPQDEENIKLALKTKLSNLEELKNDFDKCKSLMSYLENGQATLDYNKDLKLPLDVSHIVRFDGEDLDLCSLLDAYNVLIDRKRLEIKPLNEADVIKQTERFAALNDQFSFLIQDMEKLHSDLINFHGKLQNESMDNTINRNRKIFQPLQLGSLIENDTDSNSAVLAVPLPLSPSTSKDNIVFDDCKTSSPL